MLTGVNHITLAVTDLSRSVTFYTEVLGGILRADWQRGAYLDLGGIWLCLALEDAVPPRSDDTHIAFSTDDFEVMVARITAAAPLWKDNISEGASLYFCDPDGHKLELHTGTLETRLAHYADSEVRIYQAK